MRGAPAADVVVVGGGLSGVLVAERLAHASLRTLILEAGPAPSRPLPNDWRRFESRFARALDVDERRWPLETRGGAYDWLRVRRLGGRSLVWGGWCARPTAQSLRDAHAAGVPWPVTLDELAPYVARVERWLGVKTARIPAGVAAAARTLGVGVSPKRCAVVDGGTRPLTSIDRIERAAVGADSVAVRLELDRERRVRGVWTRARSRGERLVSCARVVLCASPFETARILVASGIEEGVGDGFVDHMVASCIALVDRPALGAAGVRPLERAARIDRFVNVAGGRRRDYLGGFTGEMRGPLPALDLDAGLRASLGIDARSARDASFFVVHMLGETFPCKRRRVRFDEARRDALGRATPVLHFARRADERRLAADMRDAVAAVADALARHAALIVPIRDPLSPGGIAHEAGTCRMGRGDGVTDCFGAVRGTRGLWVADASVMPSALDSHPTVTVLALALRTAERILASDRP